MKIEEVKIKMEKAIDSLKNNFSGVRTARANPGLVENVYVDVYGQKMPMKQIASIHAQGNKSLVITPFDKNNLPAIEKAISVAGLGLTPQNDKHMIRINIPDLTEARRMELEKIVKTLAEEGKVAIRNIRRDSLDGIKKDQTLSQDDSKLLQDKVQKLTDEFNVKIDALLKNKDAELKEI